MRAQPLPGSHPSQVPEIRDWIIRSLQPDAELRRIYDEVVRATSINGHNFPTDPGVELWGLERSKLFWIPRHEQEIITEAKHTLPDDLVLSMDDIPYPCGFAVFEEPFSGIDSISGMEMQAVIKALRWSPLNLIEDEHYDVVCEDDHPKIIGRSMAMSAWAYETIGHGPMWLPLGRFDWQIGQNWKEYFTEYLAKIDDFHFESLYEDRARFMAMWALMNTQSPRLYLPTRAEAKRDARRHDARPERAVHVVRWDPSRYEQEHASKTGRHVTVRYHVTGFWRRQVHGPGRSLRRWQYIPPHWRGPLSAPVKGETVTVSKVEP